LFLCGDADQSRPAGMRLNARELMCFAQHSERIDKQGYLEKRGAFNTQFRKRWFALKGNLLFYYRCKEDMEPQGVIVLAGCRPETADRLSDDQLYVFKLKFDFGEAGTREYELAASTGNDRHPAASRWAVRKVRRGGGA
jgi:hypothetical protein